jgi:hypothetical protein
MAVSLLNVLIDEKVLALLDDGLLRDDLKDDERGFSRAEVAAVIHAALWMHSARSGSFACAYAMDALFQAIGLKTWTFKEPEQASCPTCKSPEPHRHPTNDFGGAGPRCKDPWHGAALETCELCDGTKQTYPAGSFEPKPCPACTSVNRRVE